MHTHTPDSRPKPDARPEPQRSGRLARWRRSRLGRALIALLVLLLAWFVIVGGPTGSGARPAHALLDFCPSFLKNEDAPRVTPFRSGVESMLPSTSPAGVVMD
uniref:hypothetical protein n=1 Tax=uncultured Aeromicrobium sp. TaxID=337820 RepID=UPI0025CCB02F